jgi:hypothetical protein
MNRVHLFLLAFVAAGSFACATKVTVYDDGKVKVMLRSRGGAPSDLEHPLIIAPVRLNHILSRIDVRMSAKEGQQRRPAIPLESLDKIAAAFAKGLAEADPDQEVMVMSVRTQKRFGVFNQDYLTSFVGYQREGILFVHLSRSEWEVPPRREKRLPEPAIGEFPTKFRIVASDKMEMVDPQSLAIDWGAKLFERPTRTRLTPDGKLVRRTILLEESDPEPEAQAEGEQQEKSRRDVLPIPAGVSSATLRALADLEDERKAGTINEATYARRRLQILEKEAGY